MNARHWRWALAAAAAIVVAVGALVLWSNLRGDFESSGGSSSVPVTPELVARGAYLARAGNCAGCHTARGGAPYAGALGIATPFGTVYTSNLTPDSRTGIGAWSAGDFWRAMHNGRARDGRLLYPAFPYPNYTQVTREDSDAIYAFLRTQTAVDQPNRAHDVRFPYDTQAALAIWRSLFFRAEVFEKRIERSPEWNRGAYLVRGLGHCEACHSRRNVLGATSGRVELSGGMIPLQDWYAPSLSSAREAGVAKWHADDVVAMLKTGTSSKGSVLGPMAEVVFRSTQHMTDADLRSIAVFLQDLPQSDARSPQLVQPSGAAMSRGALIYDQRCAECHGAQGQGAAGAYPPLAGNRKLTMDSATNVVRVIVDGGFPPTTEGNPRPYGMPPFGPSLSNADAADVITYVRNSWGNSAGPISELEVMRRR